MASRGGAPGRTEDPTTEGKPWPGGTVGSPASHSGAYSQREAILRAMRYRPWLMAVLVPQTFITRAFSPERRSTSLRVLILHPLSLCSCLMNAPPRPMMRDDACARRGGGCVGIWGKGRDVHTMSNFYDPKQSDKNNGRQRFTVLSIVSSSVTGPLKSTGGIRLSAPVLPYEPLHRSALGPTFDHLSKTQYQSLRS